MEPWLRCHGHSRLKCSLGWTAPALGGYPGWEWDLVAQQFEHGPPMMRQARHHRGCALLPLPGRAWRRRQPEALMEPAEVVATADQPHPRRQRRLGVGDSPPPAHQVARALRKVAFSRSM
jgi:hypothetical protein